MSLLPHCICEPFKAIVGDYDPRCSRHIGAKRPTLAPEPLCVCPNPCKWCAMEQVRRQRLADHPLNATPVVDQKAGFLTDNEILSIARQHTVLNGSHEFCNYVDFARAILAAASAASGDKP